MKLFNAAALVAATAAVCPSLTCWTLNAEKDSCTLVDSCVAVVCGATEMTMTVDQAVFGEQNILSVAGLAAAAETDHYYKTCALGDASCLTPVLNGDTLTFTAKMQQVGNSRTRSVADTIIDLGGGLNVVTSPFGVGVDFTCSYDTTVTLTSEEFDVQDVSVEGTHTSSGTLDGGFTLTAGTGEAIVLGEIINVAAAWSLAIDNIEPYFKSCIVTHGDKTVSVIKDGCHATVLGATAPASTETSVAFDFRTFVIEGETATGQTVACDVQLCAAETNCAKVATCPTDAFQFL